MLIRGCDMNAYFQIVSVDGTSVIRIHPATDGGEGIRKEELVEYLQIKNLVYEPKDLIAALASDQISDVYTLSHFDSKDSETVKIAISPDNMTVIARFIPPFEGGNAMPIEEFKRELSMRGIVEGIDDDIIENFYKNKCYCTDVIVATGTPAKQGTDAKIEYFFNTDPKVRPTLNEDGSVDFFHLNTISHCKAGDLLAKLTPAVKGEAGINVKGERIKPRDVRSAILKYGRNITISEDKCNLYSDVSGHVSLVGGKVFVSNVLEVENVDNAVGNIDYDGSVLVNGNVCENFSVKAQGSIEIRGIVEGAYLEAGENIVIVRGMNGKYKGTLKAGGNVVSKFIENASVNIGGSLDTEAIMHSTVIAGGEVHVTGKKGFISGGKVSATSLISVKNLGSQMGTDTMVEVGMDASVKEKAAELQKEIATINKELATVKPVLEGAKAKMAAGIKLSQDQLLQIQKLALLCNQKTQRLNECMEEYTQAQNEMENETQGQIIVTGDVYQGVKICIGDVSTTVKGGMKYCRFIKEAGEVKMAAIY